MVLRLKKTNVLHLLVRVLGCLKALAGFDCSLIVALTDCLKIDHDCYSAAASIAPSASNSPVTSSTDDPLT